MEKYTIIVTVYNKEKYLERCLDTVCNQTYKNYRVMVVNDGSKDHSEEIILKYRKKYKIEYYFKENSGVSDTRNFAVNKIETPYFMFVDADDYISLDLFREAEKYNGYDILSFNGIHLADDYQFIKYMYKTPYKGNGSNFLVNLYHNACEFKVPWGYIYNTEYFISNKFVYPYGRIMEDYYLTPFIIAQANKIISIDYIGYYYIETPNSIITSEENQDIITQTYLDFYDMIIERLDTYEYNNYVKTEHMAFVVYNMIWHGSHLKGKKRTEYIEDMFNLNAFSYISWRGKKEKFRIFLIKIGWYYPLRRFVKWLKKHNGFFVFIKKVIVKIFTILFKPIVFICHLPKKIFCSMSGKALKKKKKIKYKKKRLDKYKKKEIRKRKIEKQVSKIKNIMKKMHIFYPIKWHIYLPLKYQIKYRDLNEVINSYANKKVYMYGEETLCEYYASQLNLQNWRMLKNFNKNIFKAKYLFAQKTPEVKKFIKENHLYPRRNYLFFDDILKFLQKYVD